MKKPNFFIIGAPKCGTTALASWLSEHPNVYMSPVKEPHFYSRDLNNRQAHTRKAYERLFKGVNDQHHAVGEASVWYLYSSEAVKNILAEIPDAKFIVCLRNPVEMAASLHNQQIVAANETIEDFATAWGAQSERKTGANVPKLCQDSQLLLYGPACKLGGQLDRLYRHCDKSQVKLVFLDDIKADTRGAYSQVLSFLGLPDDRRQEFPVVNGATERKSLFWARAIKVVQRIKKKLGIPRLGTGIFSFIDQLNRRKREHVDLDEAMRSTLENYFRQDIQCLEYITGRNLSHWK